MQGTYEISTGTAELIPDPYYSDAFTLEINGVPSSHVRIGDPAHLDFEYMRWIAAIVEKLVDDHLSPSTLRVTHLGGAGCSLPRYFAHIWPRSRHTVVELDAKLAEYVREWFDIPRSPTVKIRVGDAYQETLGFKRGTRDVIIRDVFHGDTTPKPLVSPAFYSAAAESLSASGFYVANCGDYSHLRGARAELRAMSEVFSHIAVIADPPMLKGRRYGNIILIGSQLPLPDEGSPDAASLARQLLGGGVPAHYKDVAWTRNFMTRDS